MLQPRAIAFATLAALGLAVPFPVSAEPPNTGGTLSSETTPALGGTLSVAGNAICDTDGNTCVELEKTPNDDTFRLDLGGRADAFLADFDGTDAEFLFDLGANGDWTNRSSLTVPGAGGQGVVIDGSQGNTGSFQHLFQTVLTSTGGWGSITGKMSSSSRHVLTGASAFGSIGASPTFTPAGIGASKESEIIHKGTGKAGLLFGDMSLVNVRSSGDAGVAAAYFGQVWPGASGSNIDFAAGFVMPGFYADGGEVGSAGTIDRTIGFWYQGHLHDDATYEVGFLHDNCDWFASVGQCTGGAIAGPDTTGAWAFLSEGSDPSSFGGAVTVVGALDSEGRSVQLDGHGHLYETDLDATPGNAITVTTGGTYVGWVTATAGLTSGGVTLQTADATADGITVADAGNYRITWGMAASNGNNITIICCPHVDNVIPAASPCDVRKLGTAGDVGSFGKAGSLALTASQQVDLRCTTLVGENGNAIDLWSVHFLVDRL